MSHFFGQNLKAIRLENKMSQEELGKLLYKGQKTIGNWETGYSEPCIDDLIRISELFVIDVDTLFKTEIKNSNPKTKASRNRHKAAEGELTTIPAAIADIKYTLQQDAKACKAEENADIYWRDRYIHVLESHFTQPVAQAISEEKLESLMTQVLALQKMVAELNGTDANISNRLIVS